MLTVSYITSRIITCFSWTWKTDVRSRFAYWPSDGSVKPRTCDPIYVRACYMAATSDWLRWKCVGRGEWKKSIVIVWPYDNIRKNTTEPNNLLFNILNIGSFDGQITDIVCFQSHKIRKAIWNAHNFIQTEYLHANTNAQWAIKN